jgi:pSer/pThr/pTyr-binding forkhead associated (FHA) protein
MAAKLILSMDGGIIKEYTLNKERVTIGRKAHNDIVIDNLAVSGEHAAIVTILNDSFLEDMDSTNGLEVNGKPTKKHFLQSNDVIEIGKYKLKYITDQMTQTTPDDFERTMVMRAPVKQPAPASGGIKPMEKPVAMKQNVTGQTHNVMVEKTGKFESHQQTGQSATPEKTAQPSVSSSVEAPSAAQKQVAVVQVLTGPNAGKELELVKNLTTLGKPGLQVAVLTRRPHGFFITHVEGENFPLVNGRALTNQAHQLNEHDVIELAGVKMEFYFKG